MSTIATATVFFALGGCAGALIVCALYAMELSRIALFLRHRNRTSNARVALGTPAPALAGLTRAINDELDRAAAERVDAERDRGEFQRDLAALSHDIRTPLMGAKGYLQLASDERDGLARQARTEAAIERIDSTCTLLDQLFSYTKASDPDLALEREPVLVRPLVESVLVGHYPEFEERSWEPVLDFEDPTFAIEGDRDALARIFENLVANALRHGAGAPVVRQRVDGRTARISISNPVADADAIDASRLFERFYQADAARGGTGAGLGLATSAKLAEAMGMRLSARLDADVLTLEIEVDGRQM